MIGLDKFFAKQEPSLHPKVAFWRSVLGKESRIERLSVTFVREKEGFVFGPAKLLVHFHDAAGQEVQAPDEVDWDEKLNAELIRMKAKASSFDNETERFGMVFTDRFRRVENRFGDTFYNSVLVTYLQQSAFDKLSPTREALRDMREYRPSPGRQLEECEDMIEEVIGYCIDALYGPLGYEQQTTVDIVAGALGYYLDERFSISDRRLLARTQPAL